MRGCLVTLEGSEGAGKSTCMETVRAILSHRGIDVVTTREPGGTALGERLRAILLDPGIEGISADVELLMMFAARAQHIHDVIEPALSRGSWVISDRFTDASYAYQGGGRGLQSHRIAELENWVQGKLRPDLTLLLDTPVELGLERAGNRSQPDRFEAENLAFFDRVRATYLARADSEPQRIRVIATDQTLDEVKSGIEQTLRDFLQARGYQD